MGFRDKAKAAMAAARGDVTFDLAEWASAHDLTFADEAPIRGIAFLPDGAELSNLCFGELPGGERGAVGHEFKPNRGNSSTKRHTRAAVRVPEGVASLRRFSLTNAFELDPGLVEETGDQRLDPADFGFDSQRSGFDAARALVNRAGWKLTGAEGLDGGLLARLLSGEVGALMAAYPDPVQLKYVFGTLTLRRDGGYLNGAELDSHCETLCAIAKAMRAECLAAANAQPFETELPPPAWLAAPPPEAPTTRQFGGMTMVTGGASAAAAATQETAGFDLHLPEPWRSGAIQLAGGAPLEDALAYHAAFPENPVPGHAFVVVRQTLEGNTARIALHTAGQLGTGACAVLMRVNGTAPDYRAPITAELGALSVGVKDGVMAAWMHRDETFMPETVTMIANEAVKLAHQQGWLPR